MRTLFFFTLLLILCINSDAQNKIIDSLVTDLKNQKEDTNKVKTLKNLCRFYGDIGEYEKAISIANKGITLAQKLNFKKGISTCYISIGNIYEDQSNYTKALEYYTKSLKIDEELGNKKGISMCFLNIGLIYMEHSNYPKASEYYTKALKINEELGDREGISICFLNIGLIYMNQRNYPKALEYYTKSLKIDEELGDKKGITNVLLNSGQLNNELKKYSLAKQQTEQVISISKEIGEIDNMRFAYEELAVAEEGLGNYKAAYIYHKKFKELTDSIFNTENSKQLSDIKTNYEVEKKETELKSKAEVKELKNYEEKKRQQFLIYAVTGVLLIVIVFSALLFKRFRLTNKQKQIIELKEKETQQQNEIIKVQKHLVEEKHKEITDSINYAERIQRSFLASTKTLDENLKNYFVLFKPKDVVSGDFYWADTLVNGNFILATADSTGHGVPGAIMSLLNITSLEKAIEQSNNPADILNQTRQTIINRLKRDGSTDGGKDGMDCSLLVFDFANKQLEIAAANNPVWIIRNNELIEIKPDKMPVGKSDRDSESFTLHTIELLAGDTIYTLTDGFPDQFGGPNGKKFMSKKLKELLIVNVNLTIIQQKELLETTFKNWVGDLEQVDDVCVIGIRIT